MHALKLLLVLIVLLVIHSFFNSPWVIISFCCLGAILPLCFSGRFVLLHVLLLELLAGVLFRVFLWNSGGQLTNLAYNMKISPLLLTSAVICINLVTASLCISTFFYLAKTVMTRGRIVRKKY